MKRDLYSLLGLESDASMDLIESAYREFVSKLYPDRLEHDRESFLRIQKNPEGILYIDQCGASKGL